MPMMKERLPAFRTVEGWARLILLEAGAIRECEEHGWMRDRSDPHAREQAFLVARQISAARRLFGRGHRSRPSRALRDRRYLPGVPAGACRLKGDRYCGGMIDVAPGDRQGAATVTVSSMIFVWPPSWTTIAV
jgi:hypothetical protein